MTETVNVRGMVVIELEIEKEEGREIGVEV